MQWAFGTDDSQHLFTVGTYIIEDPEECFQELVSYILLISLQDRPYHFH